MAKGLLLPVSVSRAGGARTKEGSAYLGQLIASGLTPNTSMNPFQPGGGRDLGTPEDVIFAVANARTKSRARRAAVRFFDRLREDGLARLVPGAEGVRFVGGTEGTGDLTLEVRYVDLEADAEDEVATNMREALRPRGA